MITIAYIDPGLGLLAWQAIAAFFVGLFFYIRKTRTWIVQLFRKAFRVAKRPEPTPSTFPTSRDAVR